MELVKLKATKRIPNGRSRALQLRQQGQIPAVTYGRGSENQALAVSPKELSEILLSEYGKNSVLELDIDGEPSLSVMVTDYQYHPVSRKLLHADFIQISLEEPINVDVPLNLSGRAQGVVMGGVMRQIFRVLPIRCLPTQTPIELTHDVTAMELDALVAVQDLKLPEGVEVRLKPTQTVVAIVAARKLEVEEETAEATAEKPEAAAKTA